MNLPWKILTNGHMQSFSIFSGTGHLLPDKAVCYSDFGKFSSCRAKIIHSIARKIVRAQKASAILLVLIQHWQIG